MPAFGGGVLWQRGGADTQDQVEMGEGVAHVAGQLGPVCCDGRQILGLVAPVAPRPAQHPAQQPLVRARLDQPRPIFAPRDIGDAVADRLGFLRLTGGQGGLNALGTARAIVAPRADAAGGGLRGADRRANVHDRLRIVAGPRFGRKRCGGVPQGRLRSRHRRLDAEDPRHDPLDVPVHDRFAPVKGDGGDGGCGIGADARQRLQPVERIGKHAVQLARHDPRALQ